MAEGALVLADRPTGQRLFALLFVACGALGLLAVVLEQQRTWQAMAAAAIACAVLAGGAFAYRAAAGSVATLDGRGQRLVLERRGFGRQRREFALSDIRAWRAIADADSDGDPVVRPAIVLANGSEVALSLLWQRDRRAVEGLLEAMSAHAKGSLARSGVARLG